MAVRGTQNAYQSGNDSGIFMGKQLYRSDGQGWQTNVTPEQLYPILFEAQDISLDAPNPPVAVSRFNRSASAMKNQSGRIGTSGSLTMQFHVEDMAPWIREVLMSKDYGTRNNDTTSTSGVINIRRGTRGSTMRLQKLVYSGNDNTNALAATTDILAAGHGLTLDWASDADRCGPLEFVVSGVDDDEIFNVVYTITGFAPDGTTAQDNIPLTIDSTDNADHLNPNRRNSANGRWVTSQRWASVTSITAAADSEHNVTNANARVSVNALSRDATLAATAGIADNTGDNVIVLAAGDHLRATGSLADTQPGDLPWGRGDTEYLEFVISGVASNEEVDVMYTLVGKDHGEDDVTECLHIKRSGTDANGTYYTRTRWCMVESITPDYQSAHSTPSGTLARLAINAPKFVRRISTEATDMTGNSHVLDTWRDDQTQLNLAHEDTAAHPNDPGFPSGQSQLAIVINARDDSGNDKIPQHLKFTLRITGRDYNNIIISEDIEVNNMTRSSQSIPDRRSVYYSCNSYFEEGARDDDNLNIDLDIREEVFRSEIISDTDISTGPTFNTLDNLEYDIYAVSDRFEVEFNNEQDINEGMTIEEDIGDVPNTWVGQHVANATLQYGQLITLVATLTGRNALHRRAVYHTDVQNIRQAPDDEWNGDVGVSLMDTRDLMEAAHLRDGDAPDVCWRPPAQDIFVDWGCELRITAPKCGKEELETIIIPTSDLSFTINQNLQPRVRSDGTRLNQKPTRADRRMIEMQCTVDYTSIEGNPNEYPDWNKHFLADDLFDAEIRMYQRSWPGAAEQEEYVCIFKFGQLQLTINPVPPVNTFGPILQQLAFKALPSEPQLTDEVQIVATTPRWHQLEPTTPQVERYRPPMASTGTFTVSLSASTRNVSVVDQFTAGFPLHGVTYKLGSSSASLPGDVTFNGARGRFEIPAGTVTAGNQTGVKVVATNGSGDSEEKDITVDVA